MATKVDEFIAHRAEALAMVVLTSRRDIRTLAPPAESGLDLMVEIVAPESGQSRVFGVKLKGTDQELSSETKAGRYLKAAIRFKERKIYYFPSLIMLFSMVRDEAYYAWEIEPKVIAPKTVKLNVELGPECHRLDERALDQIISQVNDWYDFFYDIAFDKQ